MVEGSPGETIDSARRERRGEKCRKSFF
jgi:hypothetical protein